jgi:zinc-ribbon domain
MGGYRRFCVQCGTEMKQGARFCANCGHAAAASAPQPAVTSDHDLAPGDLQMPPPSPPWDTSAVLPDGALFPPHGSVYPPDRPPYTRGTALSPREDAGFPPAAPTEPPTSFGYPRGAAPSPRRAGPPPEVSAYPRPGTPPPFPRGDAGAPPIQREPFPREDGGLTFPGYDAAPPFARDRQPAPPLASPAKDLALPPPYPAAARPPAGAAAAPAPPGTDTAQFTADDFAQSWMQDVGFSPQWEPSASSPGAEAGPAPSAPERHRRLLAAGLFALVAAVIVVPAVLIAHSFHGLTGGASATAGPAAKQPASGPSAAGPSQRAAAGRLAALLAQTAADRSAIVGAVGAVEDCTAALGQAPQTFQHSAASRERLLQQLATLPGRSALPATMLQALTGAWQASAAVDTDLGKWAQDEAAKGCKPHDHADASYQASNVPDVQATNDKAAFVSSWDAIAARYGLSRYQTSQL